ncbi:hypothetical protein KSP40_PGU007289 [Platanthera guangdongensis]|uniref:Ubiquitin-like domain-containing protein n=1 Tax=Platanthera guangdongensis TaxID=2320717 RepID=A0ABR2LZ37_9ASPA
MEGCVMNVEIIWRATKLNVEVNSKWTVEELGKKLLQLTNVKHDTLKLIVPQINGKGSRLLAPFSDDNSGLNIQETGILMTASSCRTSKHSPVAKKMTSEWDEGARWLRIVKGSSSLGKRRASSIMNDNTDLGTVGE